MWIGVQSLDDTHDEVFVDTAEVGESRCLGLLDEVTSSLVDSGGERVVIEDLVDERVDGGEVNRCWLTMKVIGHVL